MKTLIEKDNPVLRQVAEPVDKKDFGSQWLKDLIRNMIVRMAEKCGVGLAAPQIGVSKRVIVFGTSYTQRTNLEKQIPETALINPSFKILSEEIQTDYESCLSCGDLTGKVPRAMEIEYSGFDADGKEITNRATGLEARILQHEIDHLDGILFFDRVVDKESMTTISKLRSRV
ncbi:TPA: peptide deformylase [Legionella pneumophila]|nr:peptide deformylase [Legionella pneumophila]